MTSSASYYHASPHPGELPGSLLKKQIQWILLARVVGLSILLGISLLLQSPERSPFIPPVHYIAYFIAAVYGYTILSAIALRRLERGFDIFAFIQICSDILFACLLVLYSGGSQSIFILVFFFPIICSGLVNLPFYRLFLVLACAIGYGIILLLEYRGVQPAILCVIPSTPLISMSNVLYHFAIPCLYFFVVGFLSSLLAERLRKTEAALSETSLSLDRLAILYKQIFDDINTGIITVNRSGSITSFNRAAEDITGYKNDEVLGRNLLGYFPGFEIHQGKNWRQLIDIRRKDREEIPIGYSWAKLNLPKENSDSLVYTFQDLSQIRRMENQIRQAEKMASIGQMAAGIAHEFRNPLAAISGAAQMLSQQQAQPDQNRRLMNIILRESDRLERNITEFLQFSKPATPEKKWFSLHRLIADTIQVLKHGNQATRRCDFKLEISDTIDCYADADQLRQVLLNLFSNCFQAMGNNGGTVTVSAAEESAEGHESWLHLSVMDTGPGIDAKWIDSVFEPFFTTRDDGTGLGLAIVWQIVESHGGKISVQNPPAGGARFDILLPLP